MRQLYNLARKCALTLSLCCLLACLPARANAAWPVTVVAFPEFSLYYMMTLKQWYTENYQRSYNTTVALANAEANQYANTAGQQTNVDMQSHSQKATHAAGITRDLLFLPPDGNSGNSLCPLVKLTDALDETRDASRAVEMALNEIFHDLGTSGNEPLAKAQRLRILCDQGLLPIGLAKKLFEKTCQMPNKKYQNSLLMPDTVVGPLEYRFPSNIRKKSDGKIYLERPTDQDMDGLAAIMYCASVHPSTPRSVGSDDREKVTMADVEYLADKIDNQRALNLSSNGCLASLVTRLAIPSDAPTPELARAHDAQEKYCLYMHKTKCMSDQDYASCKKNGMSALKESHRLACQMKMPKCVVQNQVGRGFTAEKVTNNVMDGHARCDAFWKSYQEEKQRFSTNVSAMIGPRPFAQDPNSAGRPSQ